MTTNLVALGAVTVAGYRLQTGDHTSDGVAVTGALVEAEDMLVEELRRHLALESREDTFHIYPDGRIYPDAWPIVSNTGNLVIEGRALLGATADVTTFVGYFPDCPPNRATVTWTGGYDDGTNSQRLPVTLRHAIYDLARALVTDASPIPVGALSASVGDASVTFGPGGSGSGDIDALVPDLTDRVRRYRNRIV